MDVKISREDLILIKNMLESKCYSFDTDTQDRLRRRIIKLLQQEKSN